MRFFCSRGIRSVFEQALPGTAPLPPSAHPSLKKQNYAACGRSEESEVSKVQSFRFCRTTSW